MPTAARNQRQHQDEGSEYSRLYKAGTGALGSSFQMLFLTARIEHRADLDETPGVRDSEPNLGVARRERMKDGVSR